MPEGWAPKSSEKDGAGHPLRVGYCLPWLVSGGCEFAGGSSICGTAAKVRLAGLVVNLVPTTAGDFVAADRTDSEQNARISHGWSGEVHTLFGHERSQCVFQLSTQTI